MTPKPYPAGTERAGSPGRPAPRRTTPAPLLVAVCAMLAGSQADAQTTAGQNSRRLLLSIPPMIAAIAATGPETITYGYDAKGRLVRLVRDGPVNDVTTTYQFDRADNRTRLTVTGSPNPPQP